MGMRDKIQKEMEEIGGRECPAWEGSLETEE